MLLVLGAALLALQASPADTVRPAPAAAPSTPTDAYLDPSARTLVQQARERRARVERRIDGYRVVAKQRIYAGLHTLGRNRTLFSQELAARVDWRRDGVGRVEVLGGREAVPMAERGAKLPDDLRSDVADLAFDPDRLQLSLLMGADGDVDVDGEDKSLIDPLGPESEAHYRFRTGESTAIRLPDGRTIRITELEVLPRRSDFRLLRGSMWVDDESHGVVRSVFRLARPFDISRDLDDDIPAGVRVLGPMRAQLEYLTVEYALWQGRWWLPRLIAMEAGAEVGVLGKFPVRFERSYSGYSVDATPEAEVRDLPVRAAVQRSRADSTTHPCSGKGERVCVCEHGSCRFWEVSLPADTAALVHSADLPPSLAAGGERMITGEEVSDLARILDRAVHGPGVSVPEVHWRVADLSLLRYNRVEGLSVGARADAELGPWRADATARFGVADREPGGELGVGRDLSATRYRVAGYRRLVPFQTGVRALDLGSSLAALALGRDEADYLRATGAELTGRPVRTGRWDWEWRLFAEHQHPVSRTTQLSLARAWRSDSVFPEVRAADRADQAGAALAVRTGREATASGFRWQTGLGVDASAGTFRFARPSLSAGTGAPLPFGLFAALEGAAGTTLGTVPVQGLWYLGGTESVRGYRVGALAGEAFWRGRAELGTLQPSARLAGFVDAGWAGDRAAFASEPRLLSAGVGASLLDGLVRLDLARALRGDRGWRLDLYLDAAL